MYSISSLRSSFFNTSHVHPVNIQVTNIIQTHGKKKKIQKHLVILAQQLKENPIESRGLLGIQLLVVMLVASTTTNLMNPSRISLCKGRLPLSSQRADEGPGLI